MAHNILHVAADDALDPSKVKLSANTKTLSLSTFGISSDSMTAQDWLKLLRGLYEQIPKYDRVVMSCKLSGFPGLSFFLKGSLSLDLLKNKNVLLTSGLNTGEAMKNLRESCALAEQDNEKLEGKVLVSINEQIFSPPYFAQTHTTSPSDAFKPLNGEREGTFKNGTVSLDTPDEPDEPLPPPAQPLDLSNADDMPIINTIHSETGNPPGNTINLIKSAMRREAQGIVYAGFGNGTIHRDIERFLVYWARKKDLALYVFRRLELSPSNVDERRRTWDSKGVSKWKSGFRIF